MTMTDAERDRPAERGVRAGEGHEAIPDGLEGESGVSEGATAQGGRGTHRAASDMAPGGAGGVACVL